MSKTTRNILAVLVGTAIGYGAILTAYMPIARAAVLTYNFRSNPGGTGFFKFSNSGITGIGLEEATVSEGRLDSTFFVANRANPSKSYDLAGAIALFDGGVFRGLQARGSDRYTQEFNLPEPVDGDSYRRQEYYTAWYFDTTTFVWDGIGQWESSLRGGTDTYYYDRTGLIALGTQDVTHADYSVTYTLANSAAEPVPEPITVAGTALALVGLAGLKHRKKMAS